MTVDDRDYAALFDRLPDGWSEVVYAGRRYGVTRSVAAEGHALAVYAEELGGRDVVSANLYLTTDGARLRPCEMPAAKVIDFLAGFEPISDQPSSPSAEIVCFPLAP
jgi:hypothetical protein